jgi:shikimate kinase
MTGPKTSRHVVLVGTMGSGKTTVGTLLAERMDRPFLDSDEMIESATGRTVREIFASDGEAAFRVLETAALADALASPRPAVIAAAGGAILLAENRSMLRDGRAVVVWLDVEPSLLADRVRGGSHRPLLDADPDGTLRAMYRDRAPLYREIADTVVDAAAGSPREVADSIEAALP